MNYWAVIGIACGLWMGQAYAAAPEPPPGMQTLTPLPSPVAAADFALQDSDGVRHTLADYRGKVVVLNFWATWCPPCRAEMPSMQRGWEAARDDGVVFIAVNVGEDADTIFMFLGAYALDFPVLLDKDAKVVGQYPVTGLPTTYIIDTEGRITHRAVGGREWDDVQLLQTLRKLAERR